MNIPDTLCAYNDRIKEFISVFQEIDRRIKSHNLNLKNAYQSIDEIEMTKIHNEAKISFKIIDNLSKEIISFRDIIPFHLRMDFDILINQFQKSLEREKKLYLETESKILRLLTNLSSLSDCENVSENFFTNDSEMRFFHESLQEENENIFFANSSKSINAIEEKIECVNNMFVTISAIVDNSKDTVDSIENNIIKVNENVTEGTRNLISAEKLKAAAIPVGTTLIGALIGGPVGLVVGLKIGLAASIFGGVCGAIGGKFVLSKKKENLQISEDVLKSLS